jgi:GNAT superfamily N-acetyltransferase
MTTGSEQPDSGLTVRAAEPSDAAAFASCVEAAYRHYIARMGKPPGPMLDDYAKVIREHLAFVAENDGVIAGILVLVRTQSGMLLDNVAVHPKHQGKGCGRRLLEHAESEARSRGHAHLDLYTHESMTENIEMYRRIGYVETERKSERGFSRVYMRKALS